MNAVGTLCSCDAIVQCDEWGVGGKIRWSLIFEGEDYFSITKAATEAVAANELCLEVLNFIG